MLRSFGEKSRKQKVARQICLAIQLSARDLKEKDFLEEEQKGFEKNNDDSPSACFECLDICGGCFTTVNLLSTYFNENAVKFNKNDANDDENTVKFNKIDADNYDDTDKYNNKNDENNEDTN